MSIHVQVNDRVWWCDYGPHIVPKDPDNTLKPYKVYRLRKDGLTEIMQSQMTLQGMLDVITTAFTSQLFKSEEEGIGYIARQLFYTT